MISCDQCREELAEHALGHLSAELTAAVDEHLAACPVCRHESAALAAAWTALPTALSPIAPSAELFERIAARIDATPMGTLAAPPRDWIHSAPATMERRLGPWQRFASYALAASIFLALTATFLRWANPTSDNEAALASVEDLVQRLDRLQQREAARLANSERVRVVSFHGPQSPTSAEAFVIWDLTAHQWHFFASDLPDPPAGKAYQLWAVTGSGTSYPGPTFQLNAQGVGSVVGDFPALSPIEAARAMVTIEPEGGSERPTGKPVLEAAL